MPTSRKPTIYQTDWINPFTGEVHRLAIRHTRNYLGQGQDHLEIETAKGEERRDHPLSTTGYLSHFIQALDLINAGGPVTFVDAWIARVLAAKDWRQAELKRQQGDLFQWADARAATTAKRKSKTPVTPTVKTTTRRHGSRRGGPS